MNILEKIKKQEEITGLRILDNPYTLGADIIYIKTGKVIFSSDNITCQVFVNKIEQKILNGDIA